MWCATRSVIGVLYAWAMGSQTYGLGVSPIEQVLHSAHDANDLDDAASIATEAKAFTDGRLARPDGFRQCIVDDRHRWRARVVMFGEHAPLQHGNT